MIRFKKKYKTFNDNNISKETTKDIRVFETLESISNFFFKIKFENNCKFLDLGSGNGSFVNFLKSNNYDCLGYDIDQINFEEDIFPIENESIDFIICNSVIEHIKNDFFFIEQAFRVLKKGGLIFIITPNFYYTHKTFYDDPTHINPFTPNKITNLLKIIGMKKIKTLPWLVKKSPIWWKLPFNFFIARYLIPFRGDTKVLIPSFFKGKTSSIISIAQK